MAKKLFIFSTVVFIDRLSKWIVINNQYEYILNSGFALSILNDKPIIVLLLNIFFLIFLLFAIIKLEAKLWEKIILIAVFGAGFSNLIDRVVFGGVIDFIRILDLTTVNVADLIITLGIGFIIINHLINESKEIKSKK